jgi:hypothetical protein
LKDVQQVKEGGRQRGGGGGGEVGWSKAKKGEVGWSTAKRREGGLKDVASQELQGQASGGKRGKYHLGASLHWCGVEAVKLSSGGGVCFVGHWQNKNKKNVFPFIFCPSFFIS